MGTMRLNEVSVARGGGGSGGEVQDVCRELGWIAHQTFFFVYVDDLQDAVICWYRFLPTYQFK